MFLIVFLSFCKRGSIYLVYNVKHKSRCYQAAFQTMVDIDEAVELILEECTDVKTHCTS